MSLVRVQVPYSIVLCAIAIVLLSAADAILTLMHINRGAEEIMPTMKWALTRGNVFFIWLKMTLTAAGVASLLYFCSIRLARISLVGILLGYLWLIGYHTWLVSQYW